MGGVAECALGRGRGAAGDGRAAAGYPPLGDAPGSYVLQD